jgi:phage shock protein A
MNALARIFDRVREQLAELGESIAGNLAQRELDDEIREADARLRELRSGLASLHAKRINAQERIEATVAAILQREAQALTALEAGEDALAHDVAAAIVQLEQVRDDEQAFVIQLAQQSAQMRHLVEQAENSLRRLQHQLDVLRAAETVQRAQEAIAGRQGEASLPQTAVESLLRARRQSAAAEAAVPEPDGQDGETELDARLRAAGIDDRNTRTQLVLERIGQRLSAPAPSRSRRARPASTSRSPR